MNATELKERYAQEPWGKLLIEMGMEPYDTESSARQVAEYAAERIDMLKAERDLMAMLAAPTPQFSNPLHVFRAKELRDEILRANDERIHGANNLSP